MTFDEKVLIVFISVLLSALVNCIIAPNLEKCRKKKEMIDRAKIDLRNYAHILENCLINETCDSAKSIAESLTANHFYFIKRKQINEDYKILNNVYLNIKSCGYVGNKQRKERDLEAVVEVKNHWKAPNSSVNPMARSSRRPSAPGGNSA